LEDAYPDSASDDEEFVKRPDAEKLFDGVFKSSPSEYSVIVGAHGTGKSTLAWNAASKTPGVIYVDVPPYLGGQSVKESLDSALREALGLTVPTWLPMLLSRISNMATVLLKSGKRVLIMVFIVPRTDQFLPRRLGEKRINSQDIEGFRAGCCPLLCQASWLLRRPRYRQHQ